MKHNQIAGAFLCLAATAVSAQSQVMNGKVMDATNGLPLAYANVVWLGRDSTFVAGAVSNESGYFRMEKRGEEDGTVTVSCVGYVPYSLRVDASAGGDTLRAFLQPSSVELDEVTVRARSVLMKQDRRVIMPTQEQLRASTDGVDVLRRLNLPRISVHPLTGAISSTSGEGEVVLCLNGVKVSSAELAAVDPADLLRIEYHDSPGARYADAVAVIDYITRHRTTGGSMNGDTFNALGNGYAGIHHLAARMGKGKSELSFNAGLFQMRREEWLREYEEQRVYPEGVVDRREVGMPVSCDMKHLRGNLAYSFRNEGRYYFSAQLNDTYKYVPASEEYDRRNLLYASDREQPLSITEHLAERNHSPALDVYFQRFFSSHRQLVLNAVATYIHTNSRRVYQETQEEGGLLTDIGSDIRGNKYSLHLEGFYEKEWGASRFSAGMRHLQAYTSNEYAGTATARIAMRQSESSVYGEYGGQMGHWDYQVNVTGTRLYYSQGQASAEKYACQPSVRFSFHPDEASFIRYRADYRTVTPPLSALNDVEQAVDAGQVHRGNPNLKAFHTLTQQLTAGYGGERFSLDLQVSDRYESNPIMESVFYEAGQFVRINENQRSFRQLTFGTTLTFRPWKEHLSIALMPQVNRYISRGNRYVHTATMPRLDARLSLSYGRWNLECEQTNGPANTMYGEQKIEEQSMSSLSLGYKRTGWSVQAGVFNPFQKDYWMETHDYSALTPFTARAHTTANRYFLVKLAFQLHYGKQTQRVNRQIHYEDTDAGVLR